MNVCVFVPCRLRSSRFDNKGIADLFGMTAIERTLQNAFGIPGVTEVVLLTSDAPSDDPLLDCTLGGKVRVLRGPEEDVLERLMPRLREDPSGLFLRVTGDCPLVSTELAGLLIEEHLKDRPDLTYTPSKTALGIACEVYNGESLLALRRYFPTTPHSEYLIYYFTNNRGIFRVKEVEAPARFIRPWRLTLDERNDLELLRMIYTHHGAKDRALRFEEVEEFFRIHPEAAELNRHNPVKYRDDRSLVDFLKEATTYKPQ